MQRECENKVVNELPIYFKISRFTCNLVELWITGVFKVHPKIFQLIWISCDLMNRANNTMTDDITPDGYSFRRVARSGQRGAGLGLLFKKTLPVKITLIITKSFQCLDACITSDGIIFRIIVVYRLHPKHKTNGINSNVFLNEFASWLVSTFYCLVNCYFKEILTSTGIYPPIVIHCVRESKIRISS